MANINSQIKRNRQNEKRRLRNRTFRGTARMAVKDARASFAGDQDPKAAVMEAVSALDKAAQKGAIHPRNAARRKGRLMKLLATLGAQPKALEAAAPAASVAEMKEKKPAKGAKEEKAEKQAKPAKEVKPKAETAKKPAAKSTTKTAAKKPAANKKTKAKK